MIPRQLFPILTERVKRGKVLVLTGPRQVGKTTLLKALQESFTEKRFGSIAMNQILESI